MAFPSPTKTFHHESYDTIAPTRPELSQAGKVVVVTGGGAGIGPAIAGAFATAGSKKIAILGRTNKTLTETQAFLESAHPDLVVLPLVADVTDEMAVDAAFKTIASKFGPVDVLISNAGYMSDYSTIDKADVSDWWRGLEINLKGSFVVAKAFLNNRAAKDSTVISFTTPGAHLPAGGPLLGWSSYIVSKASSTKFFDYVAAEYPDVRVFNVHPGVIMTAMGDKFTAAGVQFPVDQVNLPASFSVWVASPESEFLRGRFLWANWDVDELKERKAEFDDPSKFTTGLLQWP